MTAALSSSRGSVVVFKGNTCDFAITSQRSLHSVGMPQPLVLASANTCRKTDLFEDMIEYLHAITILAACSMSVATSDHRLLKPLSRGSSTPQFLY